MFINKHTLTFVMDKGLLKDLLLSQNKQIIENNVERTLQKEVEQYKKDPFIVIISGVRRSGKSTLLQKVRTKDAYYVNFDDDRFIDFTVNDFQLLYDLLIELFNEKNIFIFDEIQNIPGWERFVRRLHDEKKKVYVTGSNASMLSKELGTHLTGRHIPLTLYPFSFKEFLVFNMVDFTNLNLLTSKEKSKIKTFFNEYLEKGGFPEYLITKKEDYLKAVYENIIYRDIITRYKLTSEKPLKETVFYAASNIGKELSFNNIKKLTGLTSATTIKEYFEYLENSYLVFLVPRYDFSLKKQIYSNKKAYFIDQALAKIVGFRISEDAGRMLENVVFLELKRKKLDVYFHKDKNECDFLTRVGANITSAIQVTQSLDKNRERELAGLLEAINKYKLKEGLILTTDEEETLQIKNKKITVKPIWKWLLEE